MKKRILSILLAITCITALVVAVPVLAASPSNQGFESNIGDWAVPGGATITQTPSGGGVLHLAPASGSYYAEITDVHNGYQSGYGDSGYSFYGAGDSGNSVYNGAFYQSIDVYINANWAPAAISGADSFWIDMTPYHADPLNYGAEHNFHLTASGSSVAVTVDGGSTIGTITSSGWYSFVMTWSKGATPTDPVVTNMMVYHANTTNLVGTSATTYAISPGGPFPSSALAGSGYVWLTLWQNGFANDILGIDNVNTGLLPYAVVTPPVFGPISSSGSVTVTGVMVAPTIALTAPSDFAFPTFAEGDNWAQSYSGNVLFAPGSDQNATWTLSATSATPYTSGQMYCSALNNFLVNPMDVSLGAGYAGLPGGVATSPSTNTNASFILYAHQYVTQSDILFGSGTYSIVVNLMATVNP